MTTAQQTFGNLLRQRGLTGKQVAHAAALSESRISDIRRGLTPGKQTQERLIAALEMTDQEIAALGWESASV
jgi:transcriptional regulator with XRE-family HTH domain